VLAFDKPAAKFGIVAAGYVIAFAIAALVMRIYIAATNSVDRQTYSGMSAFGDSVLFLGVFGVAAIPATAAALFFLRSRGGVWRVLSIGSLAIAATAVAAVALLIASRSANASASIRSWSMAVPLRVLAAPLLALLFLLCGVFAPTRSARMCLLGASAIEMVVFVSVAFTWWSSSR
jgi:hypothetical protein